MTPRERIETTLAHRTPDRIPTVTSFRPEVTRALMQYLGVDSVRELEKRLGADGWAGIGVGLAFNSSFDEKKPEKKPGDWPGSGGAYIWHDDRTFEDRWGVVHRVGPQGKYTEWISGPLVDAKDPGEMVFFPTPADVTVPDDLAERVRRLKEEGLFVSGALQQPFKRAWLLRGMENLLCDYMLNRSFVEKLYDRIYPVWEEMAAAMVRAGIDMLEIWGDLATQDRLMIPPELWRAVDKPRLQALVDKARSLNPHLHVFIHSDGSVMEIMDDLVEVGFDVIDPIQPECVDPLEVKRLYGDRITLHGCVSLQRTLPFGTPAEVREEVAALIRECGYNGGLVVRPSNAVGEDCPLPNILAVYETCMETKP